jgi:outer membrane protein TolC
MAEERVHQAALKVESDAANIAMSAEAAYETWQKLAQVANRMKDNAVVVSKAYSLGEIPLGDLLLARRQAIEVGANAEAAQFDALEAQARLLLDAHLIWDFER